MPYRSEFNVPASAAPSTRLTGNSTPAVDHALLAKVRVLVADDNPVNAMLARHLLESFGCHVEIAPSGDVALAMHDGRGYDLIIMDCQMEGLDGYAATRRLRAAESGNQRTPVVGWTSDAEGQRARCVESGMDDVLPKPVSKEALGRVLGRWRIPETAAADTGAAPIREPADEELRALQDLFGDAFEEVANIYSAETPRRLAALEICLATGDAPGAARLAHALAGSSASIGAMRVSELCRSLELACRDGVPMARSAQVENVRRSYIEFNERLAAAVVASRS
jgi:CheY-like chemotaxis protein